MTNPRGNFLEHFRQGQIIQHAIPRTITEGDNALYLSLTGERYPLFCANSFAKKLGFSKTPVNDFLLFHIAFGRTVHDISLNAVANLGYAEIKFLNSVYPGDTLTSQSEVIGVKENSNKTTGIVYVKSTTLNQNKEEVMSWKRWVMLPKLDPSAQIQEFLPEGIQPEVSVDDMSIPQSLNVKQFDFAMTGSNKIWDDYAAGEEINHDRGLTIDNATHTMATHLYQNDAKLHFNAHSMKDTPFKQRLVYGGHVISLCRAISHEGLENALLTTAIHAGTHANPTFASDTIFARTIVKSKDEVPNRPDLGVLRLRLIGLKNKTSHALKSIYQEGSNNKIYDPNVVLDLDLSVVLPRGK